MVECGGAVGAEAPVRQRQQALRVVRPCARARDPHKGLFVARARQAVPALPAAARMRRRRKAPAARAGSLRSVRRTRDGAGAAALPGRRMVHARRAHVRVGLGHGRATLYPHTCRLRAQEAELGAERLAVARHPVPVSRGRLQVGQRGRVQQRRGVIERRGAAPEAVAAGVDLVVRLRASRRRSGGCLCAAVNPPVRSAPAALRSCACACGRAPARQRAPCAQALAGGARAVLLLASGRWLSARQHSAAGEACSP